MSASGKEDRQHQHGAEPELEGTDVLDEVLVVGLEGSRRRKEPPRGDMAHIPKAKQDSPPRAATLVRTTIGAPVRGRPAAY